MYCVRIRLDDKRIMHCDDKTAPLDVETAPGIIRGWLKLSPAAIAIETLRPYAERAVAELGEEDKLTVLERETLELSRVIVRACEALPDETAAIDMLRWLEPYARLFLRRPQAWKGPRVAGEFAALVVVTAYELMQERVKLATD